MKTPSHLIPTTTAETISRARDATERLANPGRMNLDGVGIRVTTRRIDTYLLDRREIEIPMREILEQVASAKVEVLFWWVDQNGRNEVADYERFMNMADNLSGVFA